MAKKRAAKKGSRKAVESMATRVGANVSTAEGEFNTGRSKSSPMLRNKPATPAAAKPKPAPEPPAPVIADQAQVVAAIEGASADMKALFIDLMNQIQEIKSELKNRPTAWDFDYERERNGRTKRIRARVPQADKRTLN